MAPRRRSSNFGSAALSRDTRPGLDPELDGPDPVVERLVREILDPVLIPLGFATAQVGPNQVIFCRGEIDSTDGGCVDLVLDLEATPAWRITDVRYWGFPSEQWHLALNPRAELADQLSELARTVPAQLTEGSAP